MNDIQHNDPTASRAMALRRQREEVLSLPADQALDRIHEAKHPAALVHSFPEEDLYFLIHDLGPEDALSLLAMSSDRQRDYIIDMGTWHRDRLQLQSLTEWLYLMLSADPHRVVSWLFSEQTDMLQLLLYRNIEVAIREHDQDPSIFGSDFFTHDDVYYVRILDNPFLAEKESPSKNPESRVDDTRRRLLLKKLLAIIADDDHVRYQQLLHEAANVMPAELEEEAYRLRNVRLAEKGFRPFNEAVGIYQPISSERVKKQTEKSFGVQSTEDIPTAVPHYPLQMLQQGSPFVDALTAIDASTALEQIQTEFAALCNQVISADQTAIKDKSHLAPIVKKVSGFLSIGLDASVAESEKAAKRQAMTSMIQRIPLADIFQLGYSQALHLKWRAHKWRKTAWFEENGLPLTFWGEAWLGVIGGLLLEKPLCYDNYRSGETIYKEFSSLQEINEAGSVLDSIIAMDKALAHMTPSCQPDEEHLLTYKNLLLTLFAHHETGSGQSDTPLGPLPLEAFESFFKRLFGYEADRLDQTTARTTTLEAKKSFLTWIANQSKMSAAEISEKIGSTLDSLFEEVDVELGDVSVEDLDPRFITLFWVN